MKIVNIALEAIGKAEPFTCTLGEWLAIEENPRTRGAFRIVEQRKPQPAPPPEALLPTRDAKAGKPIVISVSEAATLLGVTEQEVIATANTKTRRTTKKEKLNGTLGE